MHSDALRRVGFSPRRTSVRLRELPTQLRAGLISLALLALLLTLTPPRFPLCLFHYLTGLDCPLCGLTRAMFALARLHFVEAVRYNALSPLTAVMLLAGIWRHRAASRIWVFGAAAFAVYGVARILFPGL